MMPRSEDHPLRRVLLAAHVALVALVAGCRGGASSAPETPIERIALLSLPTAINLDTRPGGDGVQVTLYAFRRGHAKAAAITRGTLTLELYDGVLAAPLAEDAMPIKSESFEPAELDERAFRSTFGVGYSLVLRWDEARPPKKAVTVVAKWRPGEEEGEGEVRSRPASIALGR